MSEVVEYPKWCHHASKAPELVKTPSEEEVLGEGWYDSPVVAKTEAAKARMAVARAAKKKPNRAPKPKRGRRKKTKVA